MVRRLRQVSADADADADATHARDLDLIRSHKVTHPGNRMAKHFDEATAIRAAAAFAANTDWESF